MKLFSVIIDDGKEVFKTLIASKSKKKLIDEYSGNGFFEKITDVTNDYFTDESPKYLDDTLYRAGWGEGERKILVALLEEHIKNKSNKK